MEEHHNAKLQVWTLFGFRTITIPQEQKHHTANPEPETMRRTFFYSSINEFNAHNLEPTTSIHLNILSL